MRIIPAVLFVLALCAAPAPVFATDEAREATGIGPVTNLPLPRYVSLRSSKINVRRGPGLDYRKDWVFRRAGLPVRVVEEYGDWRRIVDMDDAGGWVYHAMITGRRTVVITGTNVYFRARPDAGAAPVAQAEQGVVARLLGCIPAWCEVEAEGHAGWVAKADMWGVDADEVSAD